MAFEKNQKCCETSLVGRIRKKDGEQDLMKRYIHGIKSPRLFTYVKAQRLRWLGYIDKMKKERTAKLELFRKQTGKRRIGRQKVRLMRRAEENLKIVGVKYWKEKAKNRKQWNTMMVVKSNVIVT